MCKILFGWIGAMIGMLLGYAVYACVSKHDTYFNPRKYTICVIVSALVVAMIGCPVGQVAGMYDSQKWVEEFKETKIEATENFARWEKEGCRLDDIETINSYITLNAGLEWRQKQVDDFLSEISPEVTYLTPIEIHSVTIKVEPLE